MATRHASDYILLYRYMLRTTDMLYPSNVIANKFVKAEIKKDFIANRGYSNPSIVRKNLMKGHGVLQCMVNLLEKKPEYRDQ